MPLPSGVTTITLTGTYTSITGGPVAGQIVITPSAQIINQAGTTILDAVQIVVPLIGGRFSLLLPCTDNAGLAPSGWTYSISEQIAGAAVNTFAVELPSTLGATVDVSALAHVVPQPPVFIYGALSTANTWTGANTFDGAVEIPAGAGAGKVLTSDAQGNATWQPAAAGGVSSVYGRSGAVSAQSGDYTAVQVGAIPTSAEGAASGVAQLDSGGHVPIAQLPTGTTSSTVAAGNDSRIIGAAQTANNLSDLASAATARTNLGLGSAATEAVSTSASDLVANGIAAAGSVGKVADIGHSHPFGSWVFNVMAFGAHGDGVHDDTAHIQAALDAAVAWGQSSGLGYAEVWFPPGIYLIAGPLVKGGSTAGNSQIPFPIVAPSVNKVTVALRGILDASALPHWQQTTPQIDGVLLKSVVQESMDNTNGEASVLGGPTPQRGYGTSATLFNNLCPVIDGISIQVPYDHTAGWIGGFDFRGMAQARVISGSAFVNSYPSNTSIPNGSGYEFALAMPFPANNDYCNVDSFSCEGFTYGLWLGEHCHVGSARAIYCYDGFVNIGDFENSGAEQHNAMWEYLSAEACVNGLLLASAGKFWCAQLDVENVTQHVVDPSGTSTGYVGLTGIIDSIVVSDPTNVRVVYLDQAPGHVSAPSMPASTTSLRNPFWRDAAVYITGGSVTAITVDGVATGVTSGMVMVPTGRHIAITYTVAPSWTWMLL